MYYRRRLTTNEESGDPELLVAFARELAEAPREERMGVLLRRMNVPMLLRHLAIDDAIANWDGITAFYDNGFVTWNHNFYVYVRNQSAGADAASFQIIPWDMDFAFQFVNWLSSGPHWRQPVTDCVRAILVTIPASCDPILATLADDEAGYRRAVHELLDGPFREAEFDVQLEHHARRIRRAVTADPFGPGLDVWERSVDELRQDLPRLRERLRRLADGPPIERVVLSTTDINDFSNVDDLEARLGVLSVAANGSAAWSEVSPADSSLSGIRLSFDLNARSANWAYFGLALAEPRADLRNRSGLRLRARGVQAPLVELQIIDSESTGDGSRWRWLLELSDTADTYELRFAEAELAGGNPRVSPPLDTVLTRVSGLSVFVGGEGRDAKGFVELDDIELF